MPGYILCGRSCGSIHELTVVKLQATKLLEYMHKKDVEKYRSAIK